MTASKLQQRSLLSLAVVAVLIQIPSFAFAQEAQPAPGPATGNADQDEPKTLGAITVTAQKREEQLQDVPIAITTLSQQQLQDTGVRNIDMPLLPDRVWVAAQTGRDVSGAPPVRND